MTFLHLLPEALSLNPRYAGAAVAGAFVLYFMLEEYVVVHPCGELTGHCRVHSLGWGALTALFVHSVGDGIVMTASFLSSARLGGVVSAAILVHKFSDGLTLSSLLTDSGHSRRGVWGWNVFLALATPLGVVLGRCGKDFMTHSVLAVILGLAGGGFLYVGASDILPRLHRKKDPLCWVFLGLGVALSALWGEHP
jgi:zinc transporter ZupT